MINITLHNKLGIDKLQKTKAIMDIINNFFFT